MCADQDSCCSRYFPETAYQERPDKLSFGPFNDLRKVLPEIAKALGVCEEELEILCDWTINSEYMDSRSYQDRAIKKIPLSGIPFISTRAMHSPQQKPPGHGVVIYEGRDNPHLRYAIFETVYGGDYNKQYYIVPKKSVFRLARHAHRLSQKITEKAPPILDGDLLQQIINNTVGFMKRKKDIEKYGVKVRRGIILTGEPGNGKSMACRWIQKLCKDNSIDWGVVSGGEIERTFHEGQKLESLFCRYTVTFFDDIDINYLNRKSGDGKVACAILSAMDGLFQSNHTIRIFTTNEDLKDIDEAFRRPGRVDRCFALIRPNWNLRRQLVLERWPGEILDYLKDKVDILLKKTEGFSFAELEAIRALLVTNKLMGSGEWDLEIAFKEYYEGRETFTAKRTSGFGLGGDHPEVTESPVPVGIR